jgi:hypothetical protein
MSGRARVDRGVGTVTVDRFDRAGGAVPARRGRTPAATKGRHRVLEAAFWGFVGGFALLVGAAVGVAVKVPHRVLGAVMAFGAGVLISAVSSTSSRRASRPPAGGRSCSAWSAGRSPSTSATP